MKIMQNDTADGRIADERLPHEFKMVDNISNEISQTSSDSGPPISRRNLLKAVGVTGAALSLPTNEVSAHSELSQISNNRELPRQVNTWVEGPADITFDPVVGTCEDFHSYIGTTGVFSHHRGRHYKEAGGVTTDDLLLVGESTRPVEDFSVDDFEGVFGPDRYRTRIVEKSGEEYLEAYDFDVEFIADTYITILDWRPTIGISASCRQHWCEIQRLIVEHERRHEQDDIEAAERATAWWRGEDYQGDTTDDHWREATERTISWYHEVGNQEFLLEGRWPQAEIPEGKTAESEEVRNMLRSSILDAVLFERNRNVEFNNIRTQKFHAEEFPEALPKGESEWIRFCEDCPSCEDASAPTVDEVESWELRFEERLDATGTLVEDGDEVPVMTQKEMTARVVLEPADDVSAASNNDTNDIPGKLGSFIDGVFTSVADWFWSNGSDGSTRTWYGTTIEAEATELAGMPLIIQNDASGNQTGRLKKGDCKLTINPQEGTYQLRLPIVSVPGSMTIGWLDPVDYEATVGVSDIIQARAQGHITNFMFLFDSEKLAKDPVAFFADAINGVFDNLLDWTSTQEPVTWPLDCGGVLAENLTVNLNGRGIDPGSYAYYFEPEGTAQTTWTLVPRTFVDGRNPESIRCD